MSLPTANLVITTDTFASSINKINELSDALSNFIITVAANTVGGNTVGNGHVEGYFSANTLIAIDGIRGGTITTEADLILSSNTVVNKSIVIGGNTSVTMNVQAIATFDSNTTIGLTGDDELVINANTGILANVFITSAAANVHIDAVNLSLTGANVDISSAVANVNIDAVNVGFTGANVDITSAVANVNIDAVQFNVSSETLFTGANVTIGNAGSDRLDIVSNVVGTANVTITSGAANVHIDSVNLSLSGANVDITSAVANVNIDAVNVGFTGTNVDITSAVSNVNIDAAHTSFGGTTLQIDTGVANTLILGTDLYITAIIDANTTVIDLTAPATTITSNTFALRANTTVTALAVTANSTNANTVVDGNTFFVNTDTSTFNANTTFAGDVTVNGNTIIGSATSDAIAINALVSTDVIPIDSTKNFGNTTNRWITGNFVDIDVSGDSTLGNLVTADIVTINATINTSLIPTTSNTTNIGASANVFNTAYITVGQITTVNTNFSNAVSANAGTQVVTSLLNVTGNTDIGSDASDSLTINAVIDSNVIPTGTRSFGNTSNRWANGYFIDVNISGNTTLGDDDSDIITFNARAGSDLKPSANNTYDLGNTTMTFAQSHIHDAWTYGNTVIGSSSADVVTFNALVNSALLPNGSVALGGTSNRWTTGYFGDMNISGNTILGDAGTDVIKFNGVVNSHILPANNSYNLGASANQYGQVYANNLTISGNAALTQLNVTGHSEIDTVDFNDTVTVRNTNIVFDNGGTQMTLFGGTGNIDTTGTANIHGGLVVNTAFTVNTTSLQVTSGNIFTTGTIQANTGLTVNTAILINTANIHLSSSNNSLRVGNTANWSGTANVTPYSGKVDVYANTTFYNPSWLQLDLTGAPSGGDWTVGLKVYGTSAAANAIVREVLSSTSYKLDTINGLFEDGDPVSNTTGGQSGTLDSPGVTTVRNIVTIQGDLLVSGATTFSDNVATSSNNSSINYLTVNNIATLNGNTTLGDTIASDVTSFLSTVNTHVLPTSNAYDIGSSANTWGEGHFVDIYGVTGTFTGAVQVDGNTVIGTDTSDRLVINALVNSNVIPTGTRLFGNTTNRWANGNFIDINASGSVTLGDASSDVLTVNARGSFTANVGIGNTAPVARLQVEDLGIDTTETSGSSNTTTSLIIDSYPHATFRTSKYVVDIQKGVDYQAAELLVTHDGTAACITEYGVAYTNTNLGTFTAAINGANMELTFTSGETGVATAHTVKAVRMGIAI